MISGPADAAPDGRPKWILRIRIAVAVGLFAFSIGLYERMERTGWHDPVSGRRHCGREPEAVKVWTYTGIERRPEHLEKLDHWARTHPDEVNRPHGAFCWTPLHAAARFGREDLADILLARGAQVDARDELGNTPLHLAACYGNVEVARLLIAHGAGVNTNGEYRATALHAAVKGLHTKRDLAGRLQVAEMLLVHGADVNARDGGAWTPLRHAAGFATPAGSEVSRAMFDLLLAHGARNEVTDLQGMTPLHEAAFQGDTVLVQRLLDRGADPNVSGRFTTPLGSAAQRGNVEVVELLLRRRAYPAHPSSGSPMGWDGLPLAMALQASPDEAPADCARRLRVAQVLLAHGADIDIRNTKGETLLHQAASAGEWARVELLLSNGADATAVDSAGVTPLHRAIANGHLEVVRRLLGAGADASARATDGTTPRDLAAGDPDMEALFGAETGH